MLVKRQATRFGFLVLLGMNALTSSVFAGGPIFGPRYKGRRPRPYDDRRILVEESLCARCREQFEHLVPAQQRKYASFSARYYSSELPAYNACTSCRAYQAHEAAFNLIRQVLCVGCLEGLESLEFLEQQKYMDSYFRRYDICRLIEGRYLPCLACG